MDLVSRERERHKRALAIANNVVTGVEAWHGGLVAFANNRTQAASIARLGVATMPFSLAFSLSAGWMDEGTKGAVKGAVGWGAGVAVGEAFLSASAPYAKSPLAMAGVAVASVVVGSVAAILGQDYIDNAVDAIWDISSAFRDDVVNFPDRLSSAAMYREGSYTPFSGFERSEEGFDLNSPAYQLPTYTAGKTNGVSWGLDSPSEHVRPDARPTAGGFEDVGLNGSASSASQLSSMVSVRAGTGSSSHSGAGASGAVGGASSPQPGPHTPMANNRDPSTWGGGAGHTADFDRNGVVTDTEREAFIHEAVAYNNPIGMPAPLTFHGVSVPSTSYPDSLGYTQTHEISSSFASSSSVGGVLGSIGRGIAGAIGGVANAVSGVFGGKGGAESSDGDGGSSKPVLLDLDGNGLTVDTLDTSSMFLDLDGDGFAQRMAWAGKGDGVLVFDADGDGKISRSKEIVFTEWAEGTDSDLEALKQVFDGNGNGNLDTGDGKWADFKVMVDGQMESLSTLNIKSIDLTPSGSGQIFQEGFHPRPKRQQDPFLFELRARTDQFRTIQIKAGYAPDSLRRPQAVPRAQYRTGEI